MNKETLKALKGSILKWQRIARGTGSDKRSANCPLCQLFVVRTQSCNGCPVATKTGVPQCRKTPYMAVRWALDRNGRARSKEAQKAARAELKFLRSLLP